MVQSPHLLPAPAVILELETALACDPDRVAQTLRVLRLQLQQIAPNLREAPEVLITYDRRHWSEQALQTIIDRAVGPHPWPGRLVAAAVPLSSGYYEHKNFGFSLTERELIVFLDGDLVPDGGWLQAMLQPFEDFRVSVVVGNTYMDTSSLYARCVALFWIFEARAEQPEVCRTRRLVSNSVAFRRALFAKCPFPRRDTYRGQCSELARILESKGIALYLSSGAQSCHPAPKGLSGFVERAIFSGHDECVYCSLDGPVGAGHAFTAFRRDLASVRKRVGRRASQIGTSGAAAVMACILGFTFYSLKLIAFLITVKSPQLVRRTWGA
ncbi:MAG TPA: glycosyltransferase [Steroidobacteraceae bacterium]